MKMTLNKKVLVFVVVLVIAFDVINGNIGEWDEVWEKRSADSWNRTLDSYEEHPHNIVTHFNLNVNRTLSRMQEFKNLKFNATRRQLQTAGSCKATNPIDQCWRCNQNWAENRFRLADCVLGFGYKATGGKNGKYYMVNDSSDNDVLNPTPGTIRHAVIQKEPLWITFQNNMVITLKEELIMQSDKTIDGRGAKVEIANGAGFTIQFIKNVIIHNIKIHNIVSKSGGMVRDSVNHYGLRTRSDGDGISIFGAQDIWIDHVSMHSCADGLIDAIQGSTGITLSNSHFTDHDHTLLFGASDSFTGDEKMQVTIAFNHFGKRLVQRMPRCRFGYFHVVNNDYTHWQMYAIGGSSHPTIISQGNNFYASNPAAKEVTKRDGAPESEWKKWTWISQGDTFQGGAFFVPSGDKAFVSKHPELYDKIQGAPGTNAKDMTTYSGHLGCRVGSPC